MSETGPGSSPVRTRREPPRFRDVEVRTVDALSPRLLRISLGGPDLAGFTVDEPAASVRLLLGAPGTDLVRPAWNGNEFLLPDGRRPIIRTFTPLRVDPVALGFDIEVVVHEEGRASEWATTAGPGSAAAVSGPGRGYTIDASADAYLLGGDETAIPAIGQLLPLLPPTATVVVHIEIAHEDARLALPTHPRATIVWHPLPTGAPPGDALVAAITDAGVDPDARVWIAGEAAGVQRVRRHLFGELGIPRANTTIRGYWKHGRAGSDET